MTVDPQRYVAELPAEDLPGLLAALLARLLKPAGPAAAPVERQPLLGSPSTTPVLAALLTKSIRTGTFCSYTPDSRLPTSWQL